MINEDSKIVKNLEKYTEIMEWVGADLDFKWKNDVLVIRDKNSSHKCYIWKNVKIEDLDEYYGLLLQEMAIKLVKDKFYLIKKESRG